MLSRMTWNLSSANKVKMMLTGIFPFDVVHIAICNSFWSAIILPVLLECQKLGPRLDARFLSGGQDIYSVESLTLG